MSSEDPTLYNVKNKELIITNLSCKNTNTLHSLFIFRDSFGNALLPFLSEHFSTLSHINSAFDPYLLNQIIENQAPTLVIEESVERLIGKRILTEDILKLSKKTAYNFTEGLAYTTSSTKPTESIGLTNKLEIIPRIKPFTFKVLETGAFVVLKPIHLKEDTLPVFHINIQSPENTKMKLFIKTQSQSEFGQIKPYTVILEKGRNDIFIELPASDLLGTIRLDPGLVKGDYLISVLEVGLIKN